jgi:hypothetical protein
MSDERDDGSADDAEVDAPGETARGAKGRWTNVVGYACAALVVIGVLLFTASIPRVIDPDAWVCSVSRATIDDANDDDATYNDVDLGDASDADDLDCDEAVAAAKEIPVSEDSDDTVAVASASATRWFGVVAAVLGLLQVIGGVGTVMSQSRVFRRMAITGAIAALLAPVIGFLTILVVGFIVWALVFSPTAKQTWGEVRFLGASRRSSSE